MWQQRILRIVEISIRAEPPGISDVGGVLRVGTTGVTLETVVWGFQQGSTPEDIADQYPTLTLAEVYSVIAYYLRHQSEIEQYLAVREQHYRTTTEDLLRQTPVSRLQARLRARRGK